MARKTDVILKDVKKYHKISEAEINLLTRRKNNKEKFDDSVFWDEEVYVSKDQFKKALKWLMNKYKTPTGKERANNPFGYREQLALETAEAMTIHGWYDAGHFLCKQAMDSQIPVIY